MKRFNKYFVTNLLFYGGVFFCSAVSLFLFFTHSSSAQTTNLIINSGFENGTRSPWDNGTVTTADKYAGTYSLQIGPGQLAGTGWITVTPGKQYTFAVWYKWTQFSGITWGYDTIKVTEVINGNWIDTAGVNELYKKYPQNTWNKVALSFTPQTSSVKLSMGAWGVMTAATEYFDDTAFFDSSNPSAPTVSITASPTSGSVPFNVSFVSNADDPDGAISTYRWEFGDGTESRVANPTHTYTSRGTFDAKLTVYDNSGLSASDSVTLTVNDSQSPLVTINSPSSNSTFTTTNSTVTLSGTAQKQSGNTIQKVVWDNVNTEGAGMVTITPGSTVNWSVSNFSLKPGKNDILVSVTDDTGKVGTDRIIVTRTISQPAVRNVSTNKTSVPEYEKYELTFDVDTVADNFFYQFDQTPPVGVIPNQGVTVEGIFTSPSGKTLIQPGFYTPDTTVQGSGSSMYFEELGTAHWKIRFAPQELGQYQARIHIKDSSGETTVNAPAFTSTTPTKKGFIKVSTNDTRYFEYSNGEIFWPIGPASRDNYSQLTNSGLNFDRPWMSGTGAYSTNFAGWISSAENHGNEGYMNHFSYLEHYLNRELSYDLVYPSGFRIWISQWGNGNLQGVLKPNTTYQVKLRYKTANIMGPRNSSYLYGLVVKTSGFLSVSDPDSTDIQLRNKLKLFNHINTNNDWNTLVATFQTGSSVETDFNIFLDNVTSGEAYIDEFSVRKVNTNGSLGEEVIRQNKADKEAYVDPRGAAYFDWQVGEGEKYGAYFKYVVHDKNDWIQNHLGRAGVFVSTGDGYYQSESTRARWLLRQWYRYLAARWGYSTAIHSWELNNEGSPEDTSHYRTTQEFAKYMHQIDAHRHLATTSLWCCWRPNFWGDKTNYPDVDYADIHQYTDNDARYSDMAAWNSELSIQYAADNVGKPIIRGETGINTPGNTNVAISQLTSTNSGIYYHNLLWAQLNHGAMFDTGYWYGSEHLAKIDQHGISKVFGDFIRTIDFNRGGYGNAQATASNTTMRVIGQKHSSNTRAVLWIQNKNHTWLNVYNNPSGNYDLSGTVTITLSPNTSYPVEWWNTYTGAKAKTEQVTSDSSGKLTLSLTGFTSDIVAKIGSFAQAPQPSPTNPLPSPTPQPGDVDGVNGVNLTDLSILLSNFGGTGKTRQQGDVSGNDGVVNLSDLSQLLSNFGK